MTDIHYRRDIDRQHLRICARLAVEETSLGREPGIVDDEVDVADDALAQLPARCLDG